MAAIFMGIKFSWISLGFLSVIIYIHGVFAVPDF